MVRGCVAAGLRRELIKTSFWWLAGDRPLQSAARVLSLLHPTTEFRRANSGGANHNKVFLLHTNTAPYFDTISGAARARPGVLGSY